MVTIYQKPLINMQRIRRKKSKYITKVNQQNMRERQERIEKIIRHHNKTGNKMAIHTYKSIITLKVNGMNAPIKRHRV